MTPSADDFRKIAEEAERNLNTYESKTGAHRTSPNDDSGVETRVENQFPGSSVRYGDDLSTNAGYNKRIPPEEGGDLDARGRQTRGEHFEGVGGPEHKFEQQMRDYGGYNELDSTNKRRYDIGSNSVTDDTSVAYSGEVMAEGRRAAQSNVQGTVPRKNQYPGSEYHTPREAVGDMSAEGYEAPSSVTEASRESARYNE
ncbi:hypothetical protein F5B22DRAFT_655631 [Xylaria bambusicola]|uniref:uncharacterized protein n=1 Tax=Xylaria bambusicola TaxID=326684 RepID=UPI0020072E1F|nr:uncharacterized protein F5B22DRAFT_655631 [Xylaria bambusicola]KAI0526482.1 hypothetical protein F5B22DRAFT_655631 [Xylaria bambusicola]